MQAVVRRCSAARFGLVLAALPLAWACSSSSRDSGTRNTGGDGGDTGEAGSGGNGATGGAGGNAGAGGLAGPGGLAGMTAAGGQAGASTGGDGGTASMGGAGGTAAGRGGAAGGSSLGGSGGAAGSPGTSYTCTYVVGEDQRWATSAAFTGNIDDPTWQHAFGGGINHYRDGTSDGWDAVLRSPCAQNSTMPDRLILVVWGHSNFTTVADWKNILGTSVAGARMRHPSLRRIYLQPGFGKTGCPGDASTDLDVILQAAEELKTSVVLPGTRIEALSCADINNAGNDELSGASVSAVATAFANFYRTAP